ncbi:MAG: 3-hydroxyacyl-[acyl-carrier-protein] dehydratase FabZ, partial [Tardiphaga sp.]
MTEVSSIDQESPIAYDLVDINTILKTLPHRYPFLLIDRVVNIRKDFSGIGIKNVTINEPAFLG